MRTFVHAAFLAGLFLPGAAYAADLDYPYEPPAPPPPVAVLPPPPVVAVLPPRCGFYRPCVRPGRFGYWRRPWVYGYAGPRPFVGPRPYADVPPPAGYGYGHERFDHYGYAERSPGPQRFDDRRPYGPRSSEPREGYEGPRERYREGRPYADPLGHERFDRNGDERRGGDRFDREPGYGHGGPGYRDEPG